MLLQARPWGPGAAGDHAQWAPKPSQDGGAPTAPQPPGPKQRHSAVQGRAPSPISKEAPPDRRTDWPGEGGGCLSRWPEPQ